MHARGIVKSVLGNITVCGISHYCNAVSTLLHFCNAVAKHSSNADTCTQPVTCLRRENNANNIPHQHPKKTHVQLPKKRKVLTGKHAGPATAQQANQDDPQPPVVANVPATGAPTNNCYPEFGETTTTGPPIQLAYKGNPLQPVIPSEAAQAVEPHTHGRLLLPPMWTQSSHPLSSWLLPTMEAAAMRISRVNWPTVDLHPEWMKNLQQFLLHKKTIAVPTTRQEIQKQKVKQY
jgi:hypothetical protein